MDDSISAIRSAYGKEVADLAEQHRQREYVLLSLLFPRLVNAIDISSPYKNTVPFILEIMENST